MTALPHKQRKRRDPEADNFSTPDWMARALLQRERFAGPIWEPACGRGQLAMCLNDATGAEVFCSDIRSALDPIAGYDFKLIDFLADELPSGFQSLVTNPPYGRKLTPFILRAASYAWAQHAGLGLASKAALLLKTDALQGNERGLLFTGELRPARVHQFSERTTFYHETDPRAGEGATGGMLAHLWMVWEYPHPHPGETKLDWIPPR